MKQFDKFERIVLTISAIIVIAAAIYATVDCITYEPEYRAYSSVNHKRTLNLNFGKLPASYTIPSFVPVEETEEAEEQEEPEATEEPEEEHEWLTFMATAYSNAEGENGIYGAVDCRKGEPLVDGEHIAADLSVLPYGTRVYIEGVGERTVVDTCNHLDKVNGMAAERGCDGWIDIYMGDRNEDMDEWGIQIVNLYVIE